MKRLLVGTVGLLLALGCGGNGDDDDQPEAKPEITLVSPAANAAFGGAVQVQVKLGGSVKKVEVLNGETVLVAKEDVGSQTDVTLEVPVDSLQEGSLTLTARATNNAGDTAVSAVTIILDKTAPELSVSLAPMSVVKGAVDVPMTITEANIKSVTLLNGTQQLEQATTATTSLTWTTTAEDDGFKELTVTVVDVMDRAKSVKVPVVVANKGQQFTSVTYSPAQEVYVPADYQTAEYHTRAYVDTDEGVVRVVTWVKWDATAGWRMKLTLGEGTCPHNGIEFVSTESDTGIGVIDLKRADIPAAAVARFPAEEQQSDTFPHNDVAATFGRFFNHVDPLDPADHVGQSLPIEVGFVLFYK